MPFDPPNDTSFLITEAPLELGNAEELINAMEIDSSDAINAAGETASSSLQRPVEFYAEILLEAAEGRSQIVLESPGQACQKP